MTTLYLVRHGATAHTNRRLSGWTPGVHLSDEGRGQADALARQLRDVPLVAVYSSPIARTLETARAIASPHGLSVVTRKGLGETEYGRWTNRTFTSLMRTKAWSKVHRWPSDFRFPEGESLRGVQVRALGEVDRIRESHGGRAVCVVTHADVIRLVVAHYVGLHADLFHRLHVGPGSISVLLLGDPEPRLVALNVPPQRADLR